MRSILLPLALASSVAWSAESFVLDPEHTFPSFEIRHQGISTLRGKFNRSQGRVILDPSGQQSLIEIRVDAASADSGHDGLNKKLQGGLFFNTARFPEIVFISNNVEFADGKPVRAHGELTMLGVSRPVTLDIRDYACTLQFLTRRPMCGADVHTSIRRTDFGMNFGAPNLIGDEVKLAIEVEGFRQ